MELRVSMKQVGKKHPLLSEKKIQIDYHESSISVKILIELVVKQQVEVFNAKSFEKDDLDSIKNPDKNYLNVLIDTGKAGFGSIYNQEKADVSKAQKNAVQAFEDGIFAMFHGDEELSSLNQIVHLNTDQTLTFVRLTFLAGGYW